MFARLLTYIPFSYINFHKNAIGDIETVFDLGCGDGEFIKGIYSKKWKITGMDIFGNNLIKAKKTGCYTTLIKGDINQVCKDLIRKKRKFGVVFCPEVIEHIDKEKGKELLKFVDKLANKRSVFATPRGFMEQPHEFLGDNPHHHHKSGWDINDFTQHGYSVKDLGFLPVWAEKGWGRSGNKLISWFATAVSFIFSPLVYYFPVLGSGMLAVKIYEK